MAFPDNLKRIRKSRQLSQESLAEMLEVSRQSVSKWELGICMPEAQLLLRLSEVLEVSLDALMSDSPDSTQAVEHRASQKHTGIRILCGFVLLCFGKELSQGGALFVDLLLCHGPLLGADGSTQCFLIHFAPPFLWAPGTSGTRGK